MYEVKQQQLFGYTYFGCVDHQNVVHKEENGQPYAAITRHDAEAKCKELNGGPYTFDDIQGGEKFSLGYPRQDSIFMKIRGSEATFNKSGLPVACVYLKTGELCSRAEGRNLYKVQDGK